MRWYAVLLLSVLACCSGQQLVIEPTPATEYCKATTYGVPGFRSQRDLLPSSKAVWDGVRKVAIQNKDGTWLAGNFRDTGSEFVVVMFNAATAHKETWPLPNLAQTLADKHGYSSLAVDIAGRGESCGFEIGPDCTSAVTDCPSPDNYAQLLSSAFNAFLHAAGGHGCCSMLCQLSSWEILWRAVW